MLTQLAYGVRTCRIEQEHLILGECELCAVDNLRRVSAIDIADFDIVVHVLRYGIETRVAHN